VHQFQFLQRKKARGNRLAVLATQGVSSPLF
jgi:hypothetical protein